MSIKSPRYEFLVVVFGALLARTPDNPPKTGDDPVGPELEKDSAELGEGGGQCNDYNTERNVYFGDLHVHTSYSVDAYNFATPTDPAGAYAFAKGATIPLAPINGQNRFATLPRRLDFAAVTDHSEQISPAANGNRNTAWTNTRNAAVNHYDTAPTCQFTPFVAYEWSGKDPSGEGTQLHRNVIFANNAVPSLPLSSVNYTTPASLWSGLDVKCVAGSGCQAVVIPHNTNGSTGGSLTVTDDIPPAQAEQRVKYERLAEIYQHKGNSECIEGVENNDPLCNWEQPRITDCVSNPTDYDCNPMSFIRNALRRGVQLEQFMGINPLKMGIIASTDTHNATAGSVEEYAYQGHTGTLDGDPAHRLDPLRIRLMLRSGGGLIAAWAEQNRRPNLFNAFKRREVYGTSGPRMQVRFFGGWNLPTDMCTRPDMVTVGYAQGVPMGGDLASPPPPGAAPQFVLWANKDAGTAGHPGTQLQYAQIIKGWVDPVSGDTFEQIYDVAGDMNNGASCDPNTCATSGAGDDTLCALWTDPSFDPGQNAFYYARIVENPTCTTRAYDCLLFPPGSRPAPCSDPNTVLVSKERAWSSPIWFKP